MMVMGLWTWIQMENLGKTNTTAYNNENLKKSVSHTPVSQLNPVNELLHVQV